ncbi:uncharacterized protein [Mytilus edulis]|uniref:uncharacterized protein n=1 Tax=Mytilus edulis TaxID=6550 RepID=UPI0039EE5E26
MACKSGNCQFCEESTDVKWHCKACDLHLCDVCNIKIHSKIDKLSGHKVVLSQHGGQIEDFENLRKVDLKQISCSKHLEKKCVSYCLNCDKSVCSSCFIRPFQYEELNNVYEEKYYLLEDLKRKIDACLPFFVEKAAKFRKMDDDEITKHNEIKEKISNRKNEVKDAVTTEALQLEEVMKDIWDPENNPVITERKRLCQIEQELKTRKNTLFEVLEKQQPTLVFSTVEKISKDIPEKLSLEIQPPELIYIQPKESLTAKVLGSVLKIPKVTVIQTFEVDFPEISGLVSLNDDILVMFNSTSRTFVFFTIAGNKFVLTNEIQDVTKPHYTRFAKIFDITNCNGEILLSDDSFQMRRLKRDGKFEQLLSLSTHKDIEFCGIHATNVNEIIIGFKRNYGSSTGILLVDDVHSVDETSKIRKIECGGCSKNSLFTMPKKITKHVCGNICVIDQMDSTHGRIVVIGKWGQPKWTYSGHPSINVEKDFFPNDIVTTSSSLILVAEKSTNAIHVLSKDGQFICNCISDTEITEPVSICFNKKGQIMIGCSDSGKTKLHIMELIE